MTTTLLKNKTFAAAILLSLSAVPATQGATLAHYNFDGKTEATKYVATTTTAGLTASDITPNSLESFLGTGSSQSGASSLKVRASSVTNGTSTILSTAADHFEFTLTPAASTDWQLTEVSYWMQSDSRTTADAGGLVANSVLYWSLDGGAFTELTSLSLSTGFNTRSDWTQATFDLSGEASITSAVTFRVVMSDGSNSTQKSLIFDEVDVQGVAVPEPSSAALLGLSGLALILRRRK